MSRTFRRSGHSPLLSSGTSSLERGNDFRHLRFVFPTGGELARPKFTDTFPSTILKDAKLRIDVAVIVRANGRESGG